MKKMHEGCQEQATKAAETTKVPGGGKQVSYLDTQTPDVRIDLMSWGASVIYILAVHSFISAKTSDTLKKFMESMTGKVGKIRTLLKDLKKNYVKSSAQKPP